MQTQTLGNNSIAIQIDGNGNIVTVKGDTLVLNRLHDRRAEPKTIIDLLRTDVRAIDLIGRDADLAALAQWRDGDRAIAVRCITGRAGSGKTRLAIEACERAQHAGWTAAFVSGEELRRFHAAAALGHWTFSGKLLLVVDYAAGSVDILKTWFAILAQSADTDNSRLRILLLERHAEMDSGWWQVLLGRDSNDHACAADLIGTEIPFVLLQLESVEDRRALLAATMARTAPLLHKPVVTPPPTGQDSNFDAQLAKSVIDNEPLYLLMAGVHAVASDAPSALAMGRLDLAEKIVDIESARIAKWARNIAYTDKGELLLHLCACVTLRNGCAIDDLETLAQDEAAAMGFVAPKSFESVTADLIQCLSVISESRIDAIRPDLIGETFLTRIILGPPNRSERKRNSIIQRAIGHGGDATIKALVRVAQDLAAGSSVHPSVCWLRLYLQDLSSIDQLLRFAEFIPENTLALRELACDVYIKLVDIIRKSKVESEGSRAMLATVVHSLGVRLSELGRREEAVAAAEEAVALRRVLSEARPDIFVPDLAKSLNTLSSFLSELDRREEALAIAVESISLRRNLAAACPDAFMPELAESLNNLANRLSDLGKCEEALVAAKEAVALRRTLEAVQPDVFGPALAMSLNNLANRFADLERLQEALAAAEETVALRRALVAARPDAFIPNLARSLTNFAGFLNDVDRRGEALAAAQEAVVHFRFLSATRPDVFISELVKSLWVLADCLETNDRLLEAVNIDREAIGALSEYFLNAPAVFNRIMSAYICVYIRRAQIAKVELDHEMLKSITDVLTSLGGNSDNIGAVTGAGSENPINHSFKGMNCVY